jgi:hypothetical protein
MRGSRLRKGGLLAAAKPDVAALGAFEIGLFGWVALMRFVFFPGPHPYPDSPRAQAVDADRHAARFRYVLACQCVVDPARHQRGYVNRPRNEIT